MTKGSTNPGRHPGRVTAAILLITAVVAAGCGQENSEVLSTVTDDASEPRVAPNLIAEEQLQDEKPGTPARALLEWWQAFQFRDVTAVVEMTDPDVVDEIGPDTMTQLVDTVGSALQRIDIVGGNEEGDHAAVRTLIISFDVGKGGEPTDSETGQPMTFDMVRRDGQWQYAELSYLQTLLENFDLTP